MGKKMVFVFFPKDQDTFTLCFAEGYLNQPALKDMITGNEYSVIEGKCVLSATPQRMMALVEQ